ncbi:iron complex transport system permease protein [Faunimonas pinastri]|uniref:Iron complex transport system permease protein n=1 Tax=Faunimonas pinastri TaxID=1855383 RepID=A0A1H9E704_9HYPH|nr:iron complex transport system permease protein [Faunimonas pinastri]
MEKLQSSNIAEPLFPPGVATTTALGVGLRGSQMSVLLLAALLTADGTLIVGPMSFIGLMAPHLADMPGLRHLALQMLGAALLGALLLVIADWVGRMVLFPNELPAGLVVTLLGAPCFICLMRREQGR